MEGTESRNSPKNPIGIVKELKGPFIFLPFFAVIFVFWWGIWIFDLNLDEIKEVKSVKKGLLLGTLAAVYGGGPATAMMG